MTTRTRALILAAIYIIVSMIVIAWLFVPDPERVQITPAEKRAIRAAREKHGDWPVIREADGRFFMVHHGRIRI